MKGLFRLIGERGDMDDETEAVVPDPEGRKAVQVLRNPAGS